MTSSSIDNSMLVSRYESTPIMTNIKGYIGSINSGLVDGNFAYTNANVNPITGATGPAGANGTTGANGLPGPTGVMGVTGTSATPGALCWAVNNDYPVVFSTPKPIQFSTLYPQLSNGIVNLTYDPVNFMFVNNSTRPISLIVGAQATLSTFPSTPYNEIKIVVDDVLELGTNQGTSYNISTCVSLRLGVGSNFKVLLYCNTPSTSIRTGVTYTCVNIAQCTSL